MATKIRHQIIGAATLAAIMLYLDRVCIAEIVKLEAFRTDLGLSEKDTGAILSAFFLTYALSQLPAGWLSDRFGARQMLPLYICIWSLCTILTGVATGFAMLLFIRLLFGISQAGCYPTASSLVRRWIPLEQRGTASSIVSFGGRVGGTIAPVLTAWLLSDILPWRAVLALYGGIGLFVAFYFWWICRESPAEHPRCDQAECDLIRGQVEPTILASAVVDTTMSTEQASVEYASPYQSPKPIEASNASQQSRPDFPPIGQLICSGSMWLMCILQFGINVGWVFLVSWLPTYLKDVKHIDPKVGGAMSTIVLAAGVVGMLCGGPLTDFSVKRLGKRWGRTLPMVLCYCTAIVAYLSCLRLESLTSFIIAASLIAFVTDLSVPSIWAFMQDVGGKNTAAFFGWGNMWGNLGAAFTPIVVPLVLEKWDSNHDWHEAFYLFSAGYLAAALAALFIRVKHAE